MKSARVILVGGGAFGRELISWAEHGALEGGGQITAFLDDSATALDGFGYALEHLGSVDDFQPHEGDRLVMAIGDPAHKRRIAELLKSRGAHFARLVHPSAVLARTAQLGEGVVLCPQAVVSANACIGDLVSINSFSGVGHDVVLGAYSTLSAHVDLTGWVTVGEGCFFASGARVAPKVSIGAGARIGAGATILRKVAEGAVMYTAPARRLL